MPAAQQSPAKLQAKNKFNNQQFLIFILNYIVGFGFVATIAGVINAGWWGVLIFGLTALITFGASLVYSRLGAEHPNQYGGSYLYAKRGFGRTMAFYQGWNQFIQGPILAATAPLFIADAITRLYPGDTTVEWIASSVSIAFFIILVIISTLGIKINKWVIFSTSIVKWGILVVGILLAIYLASKNTNIGVINGQISTFLIFSNVLSFMYAFGGMEDVAAMAGDAKVNNFRRTLMIAFAIILTIYLVTYIVMSLVVSPTTSDGIGVDTIYNLALGTNAVIVFVIGLVFAGISSKISIAISQSRKIVPLAQDGYLPSTLTRKNKKGEYFLAMFFAAGITILSMLIFWLLPKFFTELGGFFDSVISLGTIAFLIQYFLTFITAFVLAKKKLIKKIPIWEQFFYVLAMLLIFITLIIFIIPPIVGEQWKTASTIIIVAYVAFIALGFVLYAITGSFNRKKTWQNLQKSKIIKN